MGSRLAAVQEGAAVRGGKKRRRLPTVGNRVVAWIMPASDLRPSTLVGPFTSGRWLKFDRILTCVHLRAFSAALGRAFPKSDEKNSLAEKVFGCARSDLHRTWGVPGRQGPIHANHQPVHTPPAAFLRHLPRRAAILTTDGVGEMGDNDVPVLARASPCWRPLRSPLFALRGQISPLARNALFDFQRPFFGFAVNEGRIQSHGTGPVYG